MGVKGKLIKKGIAKIKKKISSINSTDNMSSSGPIDRQIDHNLGTMVQSRRTDGALKYSEKAPDFSQFKKLPTKTGPKKPSFKIEKSSSGFQKPILKGGQLKAKTKTVIKALKDGFVKSDRHHLL